MDGKISNLSQICSARRYTITEGIGKNLDVIDCDNGRIRFLVNVSKALDILQLYHEGTNISFVSKNGFTAREIGFLNRFEGGMLYTCGLDSVGDREGYELHGSHHNTTATITKLICDEKGIEVEGETHETALFGKYLVFKRKIISKINSNTVEIEDTIINNGFKQENYCILYHVNLGYPMLDENTRIYSNNNSVVARTSWARENIDSREIISDSVPNQEEMCYFIDVKEPTVKVVNEKLRKQFTLNWSKDTLPCFVQWKSMASGDYALGLEPTTTELDDNFRYKVIKKGEEITNKVSMTIENI